MCDTKLCFFIFSIHGQNKRTTKTNIRDSVYQKKTIRDSAKKKKKIQTLDTDQEEINR